MTGLRGWATVLLLAGFAVVGVFVVAGSLVLAATVGGIGWLGDLLADGLVWVALVAGVMALLPGVALVLLAGLALVLCAFPLEDAVDSAA